MSKWDVSSGRPDIETKFKDTLVARAKRRTGVQVASRKWLVEGMAKLGDHYEYYTVVLPEGEKKYRCSCQGHAGGEYRKICSHILYVTLARKGRVHMDVDMDSGALDESTIDVPTADVGPDDPFQGEQPSFVEGSGANPKQAREAMNQAFCSSAEPRPLPEWVSYIRETQWDALEKIQAMYQEGKKVVFLDAPTGTGKTLLGEMVRRMMSPNRAIYTCSTLTLQDQFEEDFPYADVIKGRSNYPTADQPVSFPTLHAGLCTKVQNVDGGDMCPGCSRFATNESGSWHCETCHPVWACPYEQAKQRAKGSRLAVANIAYLLTVANYQKDNPKSVFMDEPFIIVDEADVLEQQLLSFITLNFTKRDMLKYDINPPEKKTVLESWVDWVRNEATPKTLKNYMELRIPGWERDPKRKAEVTALGTKLRKLYQLGGWDPKEGEWSEEHGMDGWVYMDYEQDNVTFKPITVADYAQDLLWTHAKRWLLMSATIISAQQMAEDLGLEDDEWGVVTIDSDFPIDQRPIYVQPVANMTYKERMESEPKMAAAVGAIMNYHEGERILVHTVSYHLARAIKSRLSPAQRRRVHTYANSREREPALKKWLASDDGVMLAPSFERGVDLKDDLCRVIIIAKIPYPNLKDKQVSGRLYSRGGQGWYSMLTVRSIVQMTGRGMRSKDDYCETYILDQQFVKNVMSKSRRILPKWWKDALVRSGIPKERGVL